MIKILHCADLHLDSGFSGCDDGTTAGLRTRLRAVPQMIAGLCRQERCDMLLISGDVFDGAYTKESFCALKDALQEAQIPVFISPGNHDCVTPDSPWKKEIWPENVHIFRNSIVESVVLPELDCRIYGAGFSSMDCASLLGNFRPIGNERYHIGVFHGDPLQSNSPYNPISQSQVATSGLDYLALGHVHKQGQFRAGKTLCAWPGCAMGRGFDETGEKGVFLVTLEERACATFLPLECPRFYDWEAEVSTTAEQTVADCLPPVGNENFYRITLVGECERPNLDRLYERFADFPNLQLRDRTQLPVDIWASAGEDSLEGMYFKLLRDCVEEEEGDSREIALLAAKISKKILDGREVILP